MYKKHFNVSSAYFGFTASRCRISMAAITTPQDGHAGFQHFISGSGAANNVALARMDLGLSGPGGLERLDVVESTGRGRGAAACPRDGATFFAAVSAGLRGIGMLALVARYAQRSVDVAPSPGRAVVCYIACLSRRGYSLPVDLGRACAVVTPDAAAQSMDRWRGLCGGRADGSDLV